MTKQEQSLPLRNLNVGDLFSSEEEREYIKSEKIVDISLDKIDDFPGHPFKVIVNAEIEEMADSIKQHGILHPAIVREKNGRYEMVAGHRRKKASLLAEKETIPCIVKTLTDEESVIYMVDSNLQQREKILPSEKAFAYKMKLDALKHQGKRTDLTCEHNLHKLKSRDEIGKAQGDSGQTVSRYIRLTELIPELLELVDQEKDGIALNPAVEISYLTEEHQNSLMDIICSLDAKPSHPQAIEMRKLSNSKQLTAEKIEEILDKPKPNQAPKLRLDRDRLDKVLPESIQRLPDKEVEDFLIKLIEEFNRKQKQKNDLAR